MKRFLGLVVLLVGVMGLLPGWWDAAAAGERTAVMIPARDYKTAPADLPSFSVQQWPGARGDGYLFVSMFGLQRERRSFHLILDENGDLVYYQPLDSIRSSTDFKKQPNGLLTYFAPEDGDFSYVALNNRYQQVRQIRAVADPQSERPFVLDNHGVQLLAGGHALFMVQDTRIVDLSGVVPGGRPQALVTGCVIQEVDAANNLLFQWNSWNHIPITDSQAPLDQDRLTYVHCNSVAEDLDGNILLSSRHLSEVTKIARPGGEIIWRMGGKQNQFTFLNDGGFSVQHDVRRLENGRLTLYDNANAELGKNSRGVEYEVDEVNKTVRRTAEFHNMPETYGGFMGNMQRLPNGNTLIGWGTSAAPLFSEFDAGGEKVLEFSSLDGMFTYRAFRFPWQGFPTWPPALMAIVDDQQTDLYFSWNGSTETASFLLEGGQDMDDLAVLDQVAKSGFETHYRYEMPADGLWYFRVSPVSKEGQKGPASRLVMVLAGSRPAYLPVVGSQ